MDLLKKTVTIKLNTKKEKDLLPFAIKLIKKISDTSNAKEQYQCYLKKKNTKLVKWSKVITQQPKVFENSNTVDIISFIIGHPKTSH